MADDHESASAAWLDDAGTQRELAIIRGRFPFWEEFKVVMFALQIQVLADLNIYGPGETHVVDATTDPDTLQSMLDDDDEDDEPWKHSER